VSDLVYIERTYLQLSDEIKKLKLLIDNKDKSELDFFRYLRPLKRELKENIKAQVRKKFRVAVKKFTKKYKENKNCLPNALVALQDIMKERRRKQREILHLQRINTIKYLQEKSPLINPSQDLNSANLNMFINQTIQNQYNVQNMHIHQAQPPPSQQLSSVERDELEMLRKWMKGSERKNLSKLLSLIEVHNSTLEEIETKFKREFTDIKENIKKIKHYQKEQEGVVRERTFRQQNDVRHLQQQNMLYKQQIMEQREEKKEQLERLYPKNEDEFDSIAGDSVGMCAIPQNEPKNASPLRNNKSRPMDEFIDQSPPIVKNNKKVMKAPRGEHIQTVYKEMERERVIRPSEASVGIVNKVETSQEASSVEENMDYTPGLRNTNSNVEMLEDPSRAKEITISLGEEQEDPSKESENSDDLNENNSEEQSEESEESEDEKQVNKSLKQDFGRTEERKKLSEVSFEESSVDQEELEEHQNVNFEENMPRLDEDELVEEDKKTKKKKKRIKFKKNVKVNQQDMDIMMREKMNKKEKVQTAKSKAKKSYHAYLEHPRMRHQPSLQSPKGNKKNEDLDPLGLSIRPKKK
jgi:hypothetical protein